MVSILDDADIAELCYAIKNCQPVPQTLLRNGKWSATAFITLRSHQVSSQNSPCGFNLPVSSYSVSTVCSSTPPPSQSSLPDVCHSVPVSEGESLNHPDHNHSNMFVEQAEPCSCSGENRAITILERERERDKHSEM